MSFIPSRELLLPTAMLSDRGTPYLFPVLTMGKFQGHNTQYVYIIYNSHFLSILDGGRPSPDLLTALYCRFDEGLMGLFSIYWHQGSLKLIEIALWG